MADNYQIFEQESNQYGSRVTTNNINITNVYKQTNKISNKIINNGNNQLSSQCVDPCSFKGFL